MLRIAVAVAGLVGSLYLAEEAPLRVERGHVGHLHLGMSEAEVSHAFPGQVTHTYVPREGQEPALEIRFREGGCAIAELDDKGAVWAIRVVDAAIPTERGIRVGDSFALVRSKYPEAKLFATQAEDSSVSLGVDSLGYFSFDLSSLTPDDSWPPPPERLDGLRVELIIIQEP